MTPSPATFDSWLAAALPPRLVDVVRAAYRADSDAPSLDKHRAPLSELARRFAVSRERARQLLSRAHALLAAPDSLSAAPLYSAAARLLDAHSGVLEPSTLATDPLARLPEFATASPLAIFLLLARLRPDAPPHLHSGFFTSVPPPLLQRTADSFSFLLASLRRAATPLRPIADLASRLPSDLPLPPDTRTALLTSLALHTPGVLLTHKLQCGPSPEAPTALLRALLSRHPNSTLAFLVEHYNLLVAPPSQLGSGRLRTLLLALPSLRRPSPGHYTLRPS